MEASIMTDKKNHSSNPGVGCDVIACKYNTVDCRCSAERISVQNVNASSKGETYCSTFCPRGTC
jgi:hypothetical protein